LQFISQSRKVVELQKIIEILNLLKYDSDLNNCITRLNIYIQELIKKGKNLKLFDKKNLQLNLEIKDTDKPEYKKDDKKIIISLNYTLMNN